MSRGQFLLNLREEESSKKVLLIRSLIKEDTKFWDEDIKIKKSIKQGFFQHIADKYEELSPVILKKDSKEVAYNYIISGYAAKN